MKRRSFKFILFSVKENLLSILFILFTISLVIFSKSNLPAAHSGLKLWANAVVPSLFPFFVATELLSHTNVISMLGTYLNCIMRPFFNVPGEGSFPFIMGIISGYPTGAKIVSKFKTDGICSNVEAERLLAFTNNSGPLFIIGTVGISLFGNIEIGILLLTTHILACITVGFIFRFWKYNNSHTNNPKRTYRNNNQFRSLGKIIGTSITNATRTIVLIGGFIVIFSVIISIINSSGLLTLLCNVLEPLFSALKINPEFSSGFISGIIELTNGVNIVSSISEKAISINIILCAFLLGFGGISVVLQVFSIVSEANISIKPYIIGKLLQGTFAALYTYLLIQNFDFFNLDLL